MIPGKRYIVTKASDDHTFQVGDKIQLHEDGSVSCTQALGWIDAENVAEATTGMEYEIDTVYYEQVKQRLEEILN